VKLLAEANKAKADDAKVKKETRLLTSDSVNKRSQNVEDTNVRNTKTSKSNKKN
jgi:hypothetical protein